MLEPFSVDGVDDQPRTEPFLERFLLFGQSAAESILPTPSQSFVGLHIGGGSRGWLGRAGGSGLPAPKSGAGKSLSKPLAKFLPKELLQVDALSPVTIQVIFSRPLAEEELDPDTALASFKLSGDLKLSGSPWLKAGTKACYIIPTAVQQPGKRYTLSYRGGDKLGFKAGVDRIFFRKVRQISCDTIEVESLTADGVADYRQICADAAAASEKPRLVLNTDNIFQGRHYQIVPPLDGKTALIMPEGGMPLNAKYIPRTQSGDGRQAPQFRLPQGFAFTPGQPYTVVIVWGRIGVDGFTGSPWVPCAIKKIRSYSPELLKVTLSADSGCDVFAGRSLLLTGERGDTLKADYVPGSKSGTEGDFRLQPGCRMQPGGIYSAASLGPWASVPASGLPVQAFDNRHDSGRISLVYPTRME